MKNKIFSLLVSAIFIPLAVVGQVLGNWIGAIYVYINNLISWISIPGFMKVLVISLIAGWIAGHLSSLAVVKIFKNVEIKIAMIIPAIFIVLAMIGDISYASKNSFNLDFFEHFVRNISTIIFYFLMLREHKSETN